MAGCIAGESVNCSDRYATVNFINSAGAVISSTQMNMAQSGTEQGTSSGFPINSPYWTVTLPAGAEKVTAIAVTPLRLRSHLQHRSVLYPRQAMVGQPTIHS